MALLGCLGVVEPPTAFAGNVLGVAESRASWTNPSTGTVHTFHWRFAVEYFAPMWRYRARTWCDYKRAGSSVVVDEECNYNMFQSALQVKDCVADDYCTPVEPWGRASWEEDRLTEKLWLGGWHEKPRYMNSFRSITYSMQARFLIPNHVTAWYVGCSKWVDSDTFIEWQLSCT